MSERPWCSIIIPVLNEEATLAACLEVITQGIPAGLIEVLVIDGGSTDASLEIAQAYGATTFPSTRGRAQQMNVGARKARGQWLWFLHADTLPPCDWHHHLHQATQRGLPACFRLRFDRQDASRWLRFFARSSYLNVDAFRFGDQSLFVHREDFQASGGYDENLLLMEGHEIVRRLRRLRGGFAILPADVTTSARRYFRHGILYTQGVFCCIFCLYYLGVRQQRLGWLHRTAFRQGR